MEKSKPVCREQHQSGIAKVPMAVRSYRSRGKNGRVVCGDAIAYLRTLEPETAGIVFLDPPFNLGKEYATGDRSLDRRDDYEQWFQDVLAQSIRVLMPGGALFLYHLPFWAMKFGAWIDGRLQFQHWIAVSMKNGFVRGRKLYPAHYALLMFTKGTPAHFNRPKLQPSKCRHCGGYIKDYGGYRSIIDAKGINLSDIWDDLSPVRHKHRKHRTANELPATLFQRVMSISGFPGLMYVDPFAGTGSGVLAAVDAGMRFSACDLVEANCKIVCQRLDEHQPRTQR